MTKPFRGIVNLDVRDSTPDWEPYEQPKAPDGAPNVLFIVWDDTGFGALSPFGGPVKMPTLERLADNGLKYTQFHTTAICSPSRAAMLTGRNHTTVGMACIAEATEGYPGQNGHIPFETATIAEVLGERGYNTYMTGKWHCVPEDETRLRALLRLSRWRDQPVLSRPRPRPAVRRPAVRAGGRLPPLGGPRRQGDLDDLRC